MNESEADDGALKEILFILKGTNTIRKLYQIQKSGRFELMGRMRKLDSEEKETIDYLLLPREQWARAYSQYIVATSQNDLLIKQLNWERKSDELLEKQWLDDDFKNVIFAIDKLILQLEWSRPV